MANKDNLNIVLFGMGLEAYWDPLCIVGSAKNTNYIVYFYSTIYTK